ncbi:MAG TPA: hypothetical protein VJV78_29920 [Polyangiales bacterium]|nr:hypothetical protein [Polyangiales bacterium]
MKLSAVVLVLALALPLRASAYAEIRGTITGSGFRDSTAVQPIGGNPGTTLGEQRRLAVLHAFKLWETRLDSTVPIEIAFEFENLGCANGAIILGGASPVSAFGAMNGANPMQVYVSALANSLAGQDLAPNEPDVVAHFNSSVDTDCKSATGGFYYGFDGKAETAVDLVGVVLHELAHGFGFTSLVDLDTGEFIAGTADGFTANLRDLALDQPWPSLTNAQRRASATNVRGIAWDGKHAGKLVPATFGPGEPTLLIEPSVPELSRLVSDVGFARNPAEAPASGQLLAATSCTPRTVAAGSILLFPGTCDPERAGAAAANAGAAGALLVRPWMFTAPPMPLDAESGSPMVSIPMLSITATDAVALERALQQGARRASLGGDPKRYLGADAKQRPLLFASQPVSAGSSVSHLEELVRPNELMEPYASSGGSPLGFTQAMLRDIGWPVKCGDGQVDPGEECDEGEKNSDSTPDACRNNCLRAHCGDGVRDRDEGCDSPTGNDDRLANACRTSCKPAACGDGVVDRDEQCDMGSKNSDNASATCRSSCKSPTCGDGVVDMPEQCDDGHSNSDSKPNACRTSCRSARCGDGVIDAKESCDDGTKNSATAPNACRPDCVKPRCGDGVKDEGEACDETPGCSSSCQTPRMEPEMEPESEPDRGSQAAPKPGKKVQAQRTKQADAGSDEQKSPAADSGGCGCRVSSGPTPRPAFSVWFVAVWVLCAVRWWRKK